MDPVCTLCFERFASTRAQYGHLQPGNPDTVCMSVQEMTDRGYTKQPNGWTMWEELHEDQWDPDRAFWSCLFNPALLFSDLFPMKEFRLTPFEKIWFNLAKPRYLKKK